MDEYEWRQYNTMIDDRNETIEELRDRVQKLTAERGALIQALRPFAATAEHISPRMADNLSIWRKEDERGVVVQITLGDLRRAALILEDTAQAAGSVNDGN